MTWASLLHLHSDLLSSARAGDRMTGVGANWMIRRRTLAFGARRASQNQAGDSLELFICRVVHLSGAWKVATMSSVVLAGAF
jgi:hypothetical protein